MKELLTKKWIVLRCFAVLALMLIIGGCGEKKEAGGNKQEDEKATESSHDADSVKSNSSDSEKVYDGSTNEPNVFELDWDEFKSRWEQNLNSLGRPELGTIENEQEKESAYGLLKSGTLDETELFGLSANTDRDTGKIITVVASGFESEEGIESGNSVFFAASALIDVADPTLSTNKVLELTEKLGLYGTITDEGQIIIEENGLIYTSMAQETNDMGPLVSLTIQKAAE